MYTIEKGALADTDINAINARAVEILNRAVHSFPPQFLLILT